VRIGRILLRLSERWIGIRLKGSELCAASSPACAHGDERFPSIEAIVYA
jgi:hypothetical protein